MFPHCPTDKPEHPAPTGRMPPSLLDALILGGLLAFAWRACHGRHHRRRASSSARAPAAVHTWEGEGGRPLPQDDAASDVAPRPRR